MKKGELLLKLWQALKNLCTEAKMLANFIQKIPEENTRKRLTVDMRNDVSDVAEINDSNFFEETRKLFALIQSQRFCFYFSALYAYKNADRVETVIHTLADLNTLCQNQYDQSSLMISICNNKVRKYVAIMEREKIPNYFNALEEIRGENFITAAELHALLTCLLGKIVLLRQALQAHGESDAKDMAEKNVPLSAMVTFFFVDSALRFLYHCIAYGLGFRETINFYSLLLAVALLTPVMRQNSLCNSRITNRQSEFGKNVDFLTESIIRHALRGIGFYISNDALFRLYKKEDVIFARIFPLLDEIESNLNKDLEKTQAQLREDPGFLVSLNQKQFFHSGHLLNDLRLALCKTTVEPAEITLALPSKLEEEMGSMFAPGVV